MDSGVSYLVYIKEHFENSRVDGYLFTNTVCVTIVSFPSR